MLRIAGQLPKGRLCPSCSAPIGAEAQALLSHFAEVHGRKPTEAEVHRWRKFSKRETSQKRYPIGIKKNPQEVSGGLPSLGKRR
jgi:hypothetical protein